jgi:urease accessory protein
VADGSTGFPMPAGIGAAIDRRLMLWLSPAFPVGAFAYSHGLEKAVDAGWVRGRDGLEAWLTDLVAHGALRNDLILLAEAWRATAALERWCQSHGADTAGAARLAAVNELALALQPSAERHLESSQQGASFRQTIAAAWPHPSLDAVEAALGTGSTAYPVIVGATAAGHGIALAATLAAYGPAFIGNLLSAAIRLGVVGQTDAQRVMAALLPRLDALAQEVPTLTLDDIGGAVLRADLASLAHETQYSRLFRS